MMRHILLALFLFAALLCALVLWFFWNDVASFPRRTRRDAFPEKAREPAQEKIYDKERNQLDEILKRR